MDALDSLWTIGENSKPDSTANITFFRNALKEGQSHLVKQFEQDVDIFTLVHQRSHFVDQVLQQLWQHHISPETPVSLLAVGGYGRGELHPFSDIDLLIILDESVSEQPPSGLSDFLTQLWDIGLEIGHSVRTIKECRQQAETDITIATNLLETRLLCGDTSLFSDLQQLTVSHKTWDTRRFYLEKRQEQEQRHLKYNDTANNLEPNIKESPGGLRDIQIISWVARQHFDVNDLQGLKQKGFLSDSEYTTLESALRFLWRIRFALHIQAKRKEEKLMIDHQRELAIQLGYKETESRLAVEVFMKDYYLCARSIGQMNELLLQLFEENIILADEARDITPINSRFQIHNGYLETINSGIFAFYSHAMLELFLILQQHQKIKGVRADTIRQVYAHIHLINKRFRADIKNRSLFMEIIRQPLGITHEFRRMNKYGVLGAYLPEFGQVVGQMQHDLFHIYTVDEHTLFLVRNLRRFSCEEYKDEFPLCSRVYYELPKTELLFIAGLYHDIAKGRGGDHGILGVVDATAFCKRHNLSEFDTSTITFLVRQHLTMSATAQKLDINDPDVIKAFAAKVKTVDRLNYLYLLTVADIRATNNNLWNGWRDSLLRQLYNATRQWLEQSDKAARSTAEKVKQRQKQAHQQLTFQSCSASQVDLIFQEYDNDYFLRHTTNQIVWQTTTRLHSSQEKTLINSRPHDEQEDTLEIFIFTKDKPRLFAATTACLEQLQLNILDAKISGTSHGHTLNTYIVNGPTHEQNIITAKLREQLENLEKIKEYCPVLTPRKMKLFETEVTLHFRANEQKNHTTLELGTHDRPGLLSMVAQVFLQCDIQLSNAKLATLGDQVEDIFFISKNDGQPLSKDEEAQLKQALTENLAH
ncbi:MAG: [protein-PII] uridylyltransferase [Gammaproteobacteria bacterium]|nr:[protein-PII] uridylyltransferase [Gammaproteobacteria bacterium]